MCARIFGETEAFGSVAEIYEILWSWHNAIKKYVFPLGCNLSKYRKS